jgi:hypothetical protein
MSATGSDLWPPVSAAAYDLGAERLLGAIALACDPHTPFAEQVEAALGAALALFAAEPDLARLLVPRPYGGGEEALRSHRRWRERYADLLRRAVERAPEAAGHPRFLEPTLIGGVYFQIARYLLDGRAEELPNLLPDLREFLLVYYLGPQGALRSRGYPPG